MFFVVVFLLYLIKYDANCYSLSPTPSRHPTATLLHSHAAPPRGSCTAASYRRSFAALHTLALLAAPKDHQFASLLRVRLSLQVVACSSDPWLASLRFGVDIEEETGDREGGHAGSWHLARQKRS